MEPKRAVRNLILLTGLLLHGCGFQLRGSSESETGLSSSRLSPIQILGLEDRTFLRRELENRLINAGAEIGGNTAAAASRLRISDQHSDRRTLTVDNAGKVVDYELSESLSFALVDSTGNELLSPQTITLTQTYRSQEIRLLGSEHEEQAVREELWRRISDRILRRLSAQLR